MAPQTTGTNMPLPRPPIVAVLGHVDHGKTTLLDYIRKTNVASREAGGITQSVGAYEITHAGKRITFIDTPGHEAFSKMRSRGARIADIAILVVAADESVKPQTQESIKTLVATETPFVVAITKVDKPGANVDKVKNDLASAGVLLEGYGGQVSFQPVSAKSGDHVNDLLDLVLLVAEVENLTYDPALPATGFVLEARLDRQRGNETTVILTNGVLHQGDLLATPSAQGKVKILEDFLGKSAKELSPSAPAVIIGFEKLPEVGEQFTVGGAVVASVPVVRASTAPAFGEAPEDTLRLIVKAKDSGSLEALVEIVKATPFAMPVAIVSQGVGDVVDNDVKMAISTKAGILCFSGRVDKAARQLAEANKVAILSSDIIYEVLKAIEEHIARHAQPAPLGVLEVLAVFSQAKLEKQVVGGKVTEGAFKNRGTFEIEREGKVVGHGRVGNLQQQKKDANQVSAGNEAGLMVGSSMAIAKGDRLIIR